MLEVIVNTSLPVENLKLLSAASNTLNQKSLQIAIK